MSQESQNAPECSGVGAIFGQRSGVYLITCRANGKRYVGSSTDMRRRWREHRHDLKSGRHSNPHLQNSWSKHGPDSFTFSALSFVKRAHALLWHEQRWIRALKPEFNVLPADRRVSYEMTPRMRAHIDRLGAEKTRKGLERIQVRAAVGISSRAAAYAAIESLLHA